ncbi:unnamed protein product [Rotaria sordida]|uniref:mRNA export factor GLE1 n=1 Tax=Rotaria sordida TaxID=392033 RepID=A0A813UJV4_9BILA|nr:unnamed protein product [Rotaria sordida]
MDEIHESKLTLYRRIENIIKNIEEDEAKTNECMKVIRSKSKSDNISIGPANDLLRFLYILERQYQCDDDETRRKAREDFLEYINQFRPPDDDVVEEEEEEEEEVNDDDQQPDQSNESQQSASIVLPNPPLPPPPAVISPLSTVVPPSAPIIKSQLPHPQPTLSVEDIGEIKPETLVEYRKLSFEAQQYEKRYSIIDLSRKKQLASCIKDIMNKLRKETFHTLTNELFEFLNGQEKKVSNQIHRISNEEERLLCLSMLATLILAQLLGGDLNDIKTEIFLPLIGILSRNQQHQEFRIIFLDRLHKKCPYTVPLYPKRQSTMNDKQYLEAIGYIEKQDGDQRRLETESEFFTRMNGLIRLFCKLLVSRGPPFDKDLAFAWKWFSDVLNLPPKSNITSILIRVFLDEAGEIMMKVYPMQFSKIINAIRIHYLPRLEKETSHDQITRLRLTLEKFSK